MFRRMAGLDVPSISFTFDGRPLLGSAGDSVATALLGEGVAACRSTPVSAAARGPFCLMGACFECLVRIDGANDRQGCLVRLKEGMRVETQVGSRPAGSEGFRK